MIRIVEYGPKRRVVCPACEAVLEFERDDIEGRQTGMNEYERYITCPACLEDIVLRGAM